MLEMYKINTPLPEKIVKNFENIMEVSFPEDYRKFLQQYNGGKPKKNIFDFKDVNNGSDIDGFLGINHPTEVMSMHYILKTFAKRIPKNLFPIARDSYGNLLCFYIKGARYGAIFFWDHENEAPDGQEPWWENIYLVSDNFTEFLNNLYEYDIDEKGNGIRRYQDGTVTIEPLQKPK